jgi:hypothetical protein
VISHPSHAFSRNLLTNTLVLGVTRLKAYSLTLLSCNLLPEYYGDLSTLLTRSEGFPRTLRCDSATPKALSKAWRIRTWMYYHNYHDKLLRPVTRCCGFTVWQGALRETGCGQARLLRGRLLNRDTTVTACSFASSVCTPHPLRTILSVQLGFASTRLHSAARPHYRSPDPHGLYFECVEARCAPTRQVTCRRYARWHVTCAQMTGHLAS